MTFWAKHCALRNGILSLAPAVLCVDLKSLVLAILLSYVKCDHE